MIAAGTTRVHGRRERVSENAHDGRRRIHPSPESWMPVAERIGFDLFLEQTKDVVRRHGILRRWRREHCLHAIRRYRCEHRLVGECREMICDEIDYAVPDPPDLVSRPTGGHIHRRNRRARKDRRVCLRGLREHLRQRGRWHRALHDLAMLAEIEPDLFLIFRDAKRDDQVGELVEHPRAGEREGGDEE